jgi:hypothetical protein
METLMTTDPSPVEEGTEPNATPSNEGGSDAPITEPNTPDVNIDPAASSSVDGAEPEGSEEGAKAPETMLDAVKAAIEPKSDEGEQGSPPAESDEDAADPDPSAGAEDTDDTEGKDDAKKDKLPPFHDHPRWKQVTGENKDLKAKLEATTEATEAIGRIETYLTDQNLSSDEFNTILAIGGLIKNDPATALQHVTQIRDQILAATGNVLTPEIQSQVDAGYMTEENGLQLARAQAEARAANFRQQTQQTRHDEQTDANARTTVVNNISAEAQAWEKEWAASDPDYSAKFPRVRDRIELAVHKREFPTDPAQSRATLEKIKTEVEAEMRALLPRKRTVTPSPESGGSGENSSASAPKTMFDVVRQVVEA